MSFVGRIVCFIALTDKDEFDKATAYDRALVYATSIRQLLSCAFVFVISAYAWSSLIELPNAIAISTLLALIIFFFDQAIVGAEWTRYRSTTLEAILRNSASQNTLLAGVNQIYQPGIWDKIKRFLSFTPRLLYALIIAYFMGTMAEISIQSRAIDRILDQQTQDNNREYLDRKQALETTHIKTLNKIDAEIARTEKKMLERIAVISEEQLKRQQQNAADISQTVAILEADANSLGAEEENSREKRSTATSNIKRLEDEIPPLSDLMDEEENTAENCVASGTEICQSPGWQALNKELVEKKAQLDFWKNRLQGAIVDSARIRNALLNTRKELTVAQKSEADINAIIEELKFATPASLPDYKARLDGLMAARAELLEEQAKEKTAQEAFLREAGFIYVADYGPLDRYLALGKLHEDPKYGEAARKFSLLLKISIIFFELSPVIIIIFFKPFSFLNITMSEKRDRATYAYLRQRYQHEKETMSEQHIMTINEKFYKSETKGSK